MISCSRRFHLLVPAFCFLFFVFFCKIQLLFSFPTSEFCSSHCVSLYPFPSLSETVAELHPWWELPRTQCELAAVAWRCEFLRQPTGCAHHGVCLRADQRRRGTAEPKTPRLLLSLCLLMILRCPTWTQITGEVKKTTGCQGGRHLCSLSTCNCI